MSWSVSEVMQRLEALGDPNTVKFKEAKFGIRASNSLGIMQKDLKALAKQIGRNNDLALELYDTQVYEARLLTCRLYDPKLISKSQMNRWAGNFENWEICDSYCMGFFTFSPHAIPKAIQWSSNKKEFIKRAGFAIMAAYGFADKKADNEIFAQFFEHIERESYDDRIYVKKAVNWALRSIGKRNPDLLKMAIKSAEQISKTDDKAAQWIAKDALRELTSEKVNIQDYPRAIYRAK